MGRLASPLLFFLSLFFSLFSSSSFLLFSLSYPLVSSSVLSLSPPASSSASASTRRQRHDARTVARQLVAHEPGALTDERRRGNRTICVFKLRHASTAPNRRQPTVLCYEVRKLAGALGNL
ncbi:uncharacterized protein LY79DRAFT_555533 [Colletotrichum navitas]|uniref:Uncharacterized protein n=1 Tax=Colletotrichum navitas TaxID=681940 RepID=A0AAD8PXM8_9PEZI|nr:uncharacterized protein LY79DRAFT_555533 [Colletotrichum navitas]KAK1589994.1 hypothetical protein LY79DRAFT_555533 [Colletotrichum navitas]